MLVNPHSTFLLIHSLSRLAQGHTSLKAFAPPFAPPLASSSRGFSARHGRRVRAETPQTQQTPHSSQGSRSCSARRGSSQHGRGPVHTTDLRRIPRTDTYLEAVPQGRDVGRHHAGRLTDNSAQQCQQTRRTLLSDRRDSPYPREGPAPPITQSVRQVTYLRLLNRRATHLQQAPPHQPALRGNMPQSPITTAN